MKIAIGMSGGVDSSLAAVLLTEQGHEVTGISMSIWDGKEQRGKRRRHSCFGPEEKANIETAKEICRLIGIPFYVIDCSKNFSDTVIEYFKNEYMSARTPNPCIVCNQRIKFDALLSNARASGLSFEKFATGHYARIERDSGTERYLLKRAIDKKKDQSYFLYRLSQDQLSGVMFPLGGLTKEEVRAKAREKSIPVSEKEESQDFLGGNYRELLSIPGTEGDIVLTDGRVLGRHSGLWNYTPGQRRGLGIAYPEPLYVLRLDARINTVIVGTRSDIKVNSFIVNKLNWISFKKPATTFPASVKIRSSQREFNCNVEILNDIEAKVTLERANEAISPGQSAVFYSGDILLGGGIIDRECAD